MRHCARIMRGGLAVWIAALYVTLAHLAAISTGHIPVDDNIRIEPTPVLMAGPSSRQVVRFLSFPLEGSNHQRQYVQEMQEDSEGSGYGRTKRDYSLEDFLVWMASGDGSSEDWQHRPRDTSWMTKDVITTTVYLTTTVFTTVIPAPFTPSTFTASIYPSAVTPIASPPTKSPGDSSLESANSVHTPGGGKNLDNSSGITSTNTAVPTKGTNSSTGNDERPQSDYAPSSNSGNQIPGSTSKDKTTKNEAKTNYVTITKTVTSLPMTLHGSKSSVVTTTSTFGESTYDLTDLVHTSLEYPGPSATLTASSITPTVLHVTKSLSPVVLPTLAQTPQPTSQTLVDHSSVNTKPTNSDFFPPVTPTTVFSGTTDVDYPNERETPPLIIPSSTSSSDHEINDNVDLNIPTTVSNSNLDDSRGTMTASEQETTPSLEDVLTLGTTAKTIYEIHTTENTSPAFPEVWTTDSESSLSIDSTTKATTQDGIFITDDSNLHSSIIPTPTHTTISIDDGGLAATESSVTNIVSATDSTVPGDDEPPDTSEIDIIRGTETTLETDITISTIPAETSDGALLAESTTFTTPELTTVDKTQVSVEGTLMPGQPTTSLVKNTFRPLYERNLTTVHDIELYDLTTSSTVDAQIDFEDTFFTTIHSVSDIPQDSDDGDTSTDGAVYSTTDSPVYSIHVPNSSTVSPIDGSETSDVPILLTSVADVDVVDPAPVETEGKDETETEITENYNTSTNVPELSSSDTVHPEEEYSTILPTDFTSEMENQLPDESTYSSFITESTIGPFTPLIIDTTMETMTGVNDTLQIFQPDTDDADEGNVDHTFSAVTTSGKSTDSDLETDDGDFTITGTESIGVNSTFMLEVFSTDLMNETLAGDPINGASETTPIMPTETTKSLFSSGIEASLSVVLLPVDPDRVTDPIETITPSVLPSIPNFNGTSLANTSGHDYGVHEAGSENRTDILGSLPTSSSEISSTKVTVSASSYPTLQPSHETSDVYITPVIFTTDLPMGETNISESPQSTLTTDGQSSSIGTSQYSKENATDVESTSPIPEFTSNKTTLSGFTSTKSEQTTSAPHSNTSMLTVMQTSQTVTLPSPITTDAVTDSYSNTTLQQSSPSLTTSASSTVSSTLEGSVTLTTQGSSLTTVIDSTNIPKMTTELTTGSQPSPPSPSNNSTVPLDQRYWVRTVLEGPPKDEDPLVSWANIQNKLTQTYQTAYRRNLEALKLKRAEKEDKDFENNLATPASTTEQALIPTTVNPFENYTTIIGRRKREALPYREYGSTSSWQEQYKHNALLQRPLKYKMSPGLKRTRESTSIHSKDRKVRLAESTVKPVSYVHDLPHYTKATRTKARRWAYFSKNKIKGIHSKEDGPIKNPFLVSRIFKTYPFYSQSHPLTSIQSPSPRSPAISHKRVKRTAAENISVRLHNVTYDNATDLTELIYTVFDGEWPILAKEAVANMSAVDDMEMAVLLDQVVVVKAEEYLSSKPPVRPNRNVYVIIGGVVGGVMLLVFVLWCAVFLCKRKARADETLQPDSQDASPRSQMSTSAFIGHVNLGYSDVRQQKVEASPLPSTSHPPDDDLGRLSPSGSHDHLIRPKQEKPSQPFYKRGGKGEDRSSCHTSRDGSIREEEDDYATTEDDEEEDEATDLRRPKSSVPWKRSGRVIMDEPVYSSPKPISFQDQIIPSTASRYETTHSEMSSSDPTHQLMANMLQGAQIFTNKDQGSLFLPPPLLPPPQGFGRSQESPFIPGTSLPRFLPPPRPIKQIHLGSSPDGPSRKIPSQIDAYSYDPEAPPIPPRNYTREEAGLPPLGDRVSPTRPPMRDAQVEARIESETAGSSSSTEERLRRTSGSSSHLSESGGSEGSMPNVGRLRRRFHDLLDDAFSLLSGQRPGDKVTPLTTPTTARKIRAKSAAVQQRGRNSDVFEEEGQETANRPWSAAAAHSTSSWKESQVVVGVVPLDQSRSPRSAWGDSGRPGTSLGRPSSVPAGASRPSSVHGGVVRPSSGPSGSGRPGSGRSGRSITPVNMPPLSPDQTDGRRFSGSVTNVQSRNNEPIDPDTGLRSSDPAVPLIRAIKEELKRFKTTVSTDSSNA